MSESRTVEAPPVRAVSVDPAVLTAIVDEIQRAFEHQGRWGPSGLMASAAKRAQTELTEVLAAAGVTPWNGWVGR